MLWTADNVGLKKVNFYRPAFSNFRYRVIEDFIVDCETRVWSDDTFDHISFLYKFTGWRQFKFSGLGGKNADEQKYFNDFHEDVFTKLKWRLMFAIKAHIVSHYNLCFCKNYFYSLRKHLVLMQIGSPPEGTPTAFSVLGLMYCIF